MVQELLVLLKVLNNYLMLIQKYLVFNHVENFRNESRFYSSFKKFWVAENSPSIINTTNKTNATKKSQNNSNLSL